MQVTKIVNHTIINNPSLKTNPLDSPVDMLVLAILPHLVLLSVVIVHGKPDQASNPRPAP